jgi:hypothetical protein
MRFTNLFSLICRLNFMLKCYISNYVLNFQGEGLLYFFTPYQLSRWRPSLFLYTISTFKVKHFFISLHHINFQGEALLYFFTPYQLSTLHILEPTPSKWKFNTVKPDHTVTPIKQSPVLKGQYYNIFTKVEE